MKVDQSNSSRESSASGCSSNLAPSPEVGAASEKIKGNEKRNRGDARTVLCRTHRTSAEAGIGCRDELVDSQCGETDAEDDDDDVFLESWEEIAATAISTANGQCVCVCACVQHAS